MCHCWFPGQSGTVIACFSSCSCCQGNKTATFYNDFSLVFGSNLTIEQDVMFATKSDKKYVLVCFLEMKCWSVKS